MGEKQEGSYFDGSFWALVGWTLLGVIVIVITLGLATPWVYCWNVRWRTNNTVVDGKRLQFYYYFVALKKWEIKNTNFSNS